MRAQVADMLARLHKSSGTHTHTNTSKSATPTEATLVKKAQSNDPKDHGVQEMALDMVVPKRDRIQEVSLNVATAVVLEARYKGCEKKAA